MRLEAAQPGPAFILQMHSTASGMLGQPAVQGQHMACWCPMPTSFGIAKKLDMPWLKKEPRTKAHKKPFWHNGNPKLFFSDQCMSDLFCNMRRVSGLCMLLKQQVVQTGPGQGSLVQSVSPDRFCNRPGRRIAEFTAALTPAALYLSRLALGTDVIACRWSFGFP